VKQVLQDLKEGATRIEAVPRPAATRGKLLIRTSHTLVSAGTERMLVDFGRAGWIGKAKSQPDKVRQVIEKIATDGLLATIESVKAKLDQPMPMGYSNVGVVVEVGAGASGFQVGDRVVSNGPHAEYVSVATNLCARIPDGVSDEEAAFTVLGAIALQGIRLVQPTLGETVVVTGLGLIGLLTVQLLRANGCRVIGLDFDARRLELAREHGAEAVNLGAGEDPVRAAQTFTAGRGVDAVIITASTSSNEPVHQAALMCRKRGRIVLVGVAGLSLSRADFYEKELTFQVSCSYGPGRYDADYEDKGHDYPLGFVRWTEQRNFEAMLQLIASRSVQLGGLVSHRFVIDDAAKAYDVVGGSEPSLGIVLTYPSAASPESAARTLAVSMASPPAAATGSGVSFIGAGNYAAAVLVPAFGAAGARLRTVASAGGVTSVHLARKFGFERATTDVEELLADAESGAVVIATRHDSHARHVLSACAARKHVFVEKPLCLTMAELGAIESTWPASGRTLMVGFNRRFAPHVVRMKTLIDSVSGPKAFIVTVNAGAIPANHWTQDPEVGGGRILGEGCHFIDLLRFLAAAPIARHTAVRLNGVMRDSAVITLEFADGSVGTIHYLSGGSKAFPKERVEVLAGGRVLQLDNFRRLRGFGWPDFKRLNLWRQDKGQRNCAAAFLAAANGSSGAPIPFEEIIEVSRVSIAVAESLR
jgi:predicted dehydrogenase/threonine dehydrogenase-like Zn-dependent dehydrogenase